MPQVMPLYERAAKPPRRYDAPARTGAYYLSQEPLAFWGRGTSPLLTRD